MAKIVQTRGCCGVGVLLRDMGVVKLLMIRGRTTMGAQSGTKTLTAMKRAIKSAQSLGHQNLRHVFDTDMLKR